MRPKPTVSQINITHGADDKNVTEKNYKFKETLDRLCVRRGESVMQRLTRGCVGGVGRVYCRNKATARGVLKGTIVNYIHVNTVRESKSISK